MSREARSLLDLHICDAKALKNRLRCLTLRELVFLFKDFEAQGQLGEFRVVIEECLVSKFKIDKLMATLRELKEFENREFERLSKQRLVKAKKVRRELKKQLDSPSL
mmetsp:Transcript_1749/g.3084  ORF Transcript_1749/g.3084 Transcript_1749/m.3084 type:complete len:107 (-) Transcript_1749:1335-1655(-)